VGTDGWGGSDESTAHDGGDGKTKSRCKLIEGELEGTEGGKGSLDNLDFLVGDAQLCCFRSSMLSI